ncbi:transketolase [Magnetovibrio sp.]|uniref:transketolase n=1 Tax=Magnetovibrio sp. TaxID=2024836 RepID=UPI002F923FEA
MTTSPSHPDLRETARLIRCHSIASIYVATSGHPGGALSAADLLAYLYSAEIGDEEPRDGDLTRNRFILSKGHACPALYAALAVKGQISPTDPLQLRKLGSTMQGHPHVGALPHVETSTGSLGQGFSAALGMALGIRHQGGSGRVYVMLGDGEMQEGEVWEAAQCAAHYKLDKLTAILDYNKMQSDDLNENIIGLEPLADKWRAFGWHVVEIDGHDFAAIEAAVAEAKRTTGKPTLILAHTLKGKGVSFMENYPTWHGSVTMSLDDTEKSLIDLGVAQSDVPGWLDGTIHGGHTQ